MGRSSDPQRTARAYVRALEGTLERLHGRPLVFSRRDWDLATRWQRHGIPLGTVTDILEARSRNPPRGLGPIASAVEETWKVVMTGRRNGTSMQPVALHPDPPADAVDRLRSAGAELPDGSPLRRCLATVLDGVEAGQDLDALDSRLDVTLRSEAPEDVRREAEREVDRRLQGYRDRMPAPRFRETRDRALVDTIRRRLDLPRLGIR